MTEALNSVPNRDMTPLNESARYVFPEESLRIAKYPVQADDHDSTGRYIESLRRRGSVYGDTLDDYW